MKMVSRREREVRTGPAGGKAVPHAKGAKFAKALRGAEGGCSGGFGDALAGIYACSIRPLLHAGQAPVLRGGVLLVNGLGCVWSLF